MSNVKTKSLAELQTALQDFLLDKTQSASDLTLETPAFSREDRLQIYHEAYKLRLIDALRNDYSALENYIGEDAFVAVTMEFIAANPSHHPSLRWLGEKLPEFLRAHKNWQQQIHIVELAEFEWAQAMAFDAADTSLATLDDVRALQPEQWMTMQIAFHPSLQHLSCYSNAPQLWGALTKDESDNIPDEIPVEVSDSSQDWLIWREDLQVVYRPLDASEAWALDNFAQQKNFADVCSGLCEWFAEEQVPMQAAQYLQQWIRSGLVVSILSN
jgi:hypothetical protein